MHGYAATPGRDAGEGPGDWPKGGAVAFEPGRANLIMLVHPRCPCSRASVAELGKVMAACEGRLSAHVLFLEPTTPRPGWVDSPLRRGTAAIPGVRVSGDPGGAEARRFGATTSGHVALYDGSGKLLFRGGITAARGEEGVNAGADAVVGRVLGRPVRDRADVFGCPLFRATDTPDRGKGR